MKSFSRNWQKSRELRGNKLLYGVVMNQQIEAILKISLWWIMWQGTGENTITSKKLKAYINVLLKGTIHHIGHTATLALRFEGAYLALPWIACYCYGSTTASFPLLLSMWIKVMTYWSSSKRNKQTLRGMLLPLCCYHYQ